MSNSRKTTANFINLYIFLFLITISSSSIFAQGTTLTIHLRGVYESKISLLPLVGNNALKPVIIIDSVKNKEITTLRVTDENLPGEFVLRFDYKEKLSSTPYPSEKHIIVSDQNLELWVHPIYCNNPDSTWFRKDEKENTAYYKFLKENAQKKEMLGLLQNFLLNYDHPKSKFYKGAIKEYEKRRKEYNIWINEQITDHKNMFVSNIFGFQKIPRINWLGTEADRKKSLRENYFDEMDFLEPLMIKTINMKEWMDGYVNLYGELATTEALRDSLFTVAGRIAIEKSRNGHPKVYGWMVDYFFHGYESFNIIRGIKMLEPYLNDPNCHTSKRQEISRRLNGIETLVPGTTAPNIIMNDAEDRPFELYTYQTEKKYMIILFWSGDCGHCKVTIEQLYPWSQRADIQKNLDVVAISLDETDTEIESWHQKVKELNGWIHLRATEGVRSKVAVDYSILGIPVLILLDAENKVIKAIPESVEKLIQLPGIETSF